MNADPILFEAVDLVLLALAEADVAPGPQADPVGDLLARVLRDGRRGLETLARQALARWLAMGPQAVLGRVTLFDEPERAALAELLASVRGMGELLGRALVRDRQARAEAGAVHESRLLEKVSVPSVLLSPEAAVEFFRGLAPTIGIDPEQFGFDQRRRAFTLAVATDNELLDLIQDLIRERLETGKGVSTAPAQIRKLLDDAGVTPRNPAYAETVFRTNMMDAYVTGVEQERTDPEVIDSFPVWQYSNPTDARSRPEHAARDGNYYPAEVPFNQVRGSDIGNLANCRCVPRPIFRDDWRDLQRRGARLTRI